MPKSNQPGPFKNNDSEMPLIYGKLHRITMTRTHGSDKGQRYFHDFKEGACAFGLPVGTLITLPSGRTLKSDKKAVILVSNKDLWS